MRRRIAASLVALALSAVLSPARAQTPQTLATCSASTPRAEIGGYGPFVTLDGSCETPFDLSSTTNVTLNLTPTGVYTGRLEGRIRSQDHVATTITAQYVAGSLVTGTASVTLPLPAGSWKMQVFSASSAGTYGGRVTA